MSELSHRMEIIEAGYEYLLAYAAQGRQDDAGTPVRETLSGMREALSGLGRLVREAVTASSPAAAAAAARFIDAVEQDADVAAGAIALVLDRAAIGSLLIDNLNASIHLRALLTDLFLVDQALKAPAAQS